VDVCMLLMLCVVR